MTAVREARLVLHVVGKKRSDLPENAVTNKAAEDGVLIIHTELDKDVIHYLGEDPNTQNQNVLGLDHKKLKELQTLYPIPKNCTHLAAPSLNAEVKAMLSTSAIKRDVYQQYF